MQSNNKPIYRIDEKSRGHYWLEEIQFVNGEVKYTEKYTLVGRKEFKKMRKSNQIDTRY